ncbi:AGAP000458-PA, partial [Anopheles gambiae str. PEST]
VAGSSLALCEGGQTCLPPKECCAQGCCYLYAPPGAPRIPMASGDHVLGLLFLNHWYFWCFLFAVVLALLCTCSLWRRRRQLCGWDASARHSQSEGDSAGSCYAPPQYSRCNSFHIHAPPPYTEVASKPDLYPLVFSYTDPGKGSSGANYLMVQYFRNYIVQPVGSISGTSTVDSLSSSFICNANEANTLVPPPERGGPSHDPPGANCDRQRAGGLVCKHCCSLGDIASERRPDGGPAAGPALHKSLDTCCHVLLDESLAHPGGPSGGAKQAGRRHSGAVSSVGSNVSSLVNLEGPASSPPRATSPTAEVRELLEQIRQLHGEEAGGGGGGGGEGATGRSAQPPASYRRPSSLVGRRSKLFAKGGPPPGASRAMYIPVASCAPHTAGGQRPLRSPASMSSAASSFLSRQRHCWLSKSAPTTPGTGPGSFGGGGGGGGDGGDTAPDNRPLLLTEQEEDGEQNV